MPVWLLLIFATIYHQVATRTEGAWAEVAAAAAAVVVVAAAVVVVVAQVAPETGNAPIRK